MSNNIISINYIYLLQEREFTKTKENIYKVGMSQKENHKRFNQYPKGSILLFQMICNNCKNIEKCLIKIFKENFKLRNDIGNEYFEGDYKSMIDIIYSTIKNEKEEYENLKQTKEDNKEDNKVIEKTIFQEEIKYNKINKIIVTDYECGICQFKCSYKSDWLRHLSTLKHNVSVNENKVEIIKNKKNDIFKCICGKIYSTNSGLWKHKKNCENINLNENKMVESIELRLKQNNDIQNIV